MRFKLRQMEVFRAVMLTGSINAAARMLFVSQPAVSKIVAHTEATLNLRLFERVRQRLIPTPEAHALFREVELVYQAALRTDDLARALSLGSTGLLRVSCSASLALTVVAPALVALKKRRPDLNMDWHTTLMAKMPLEVLGRSVDLAVSALPIEHENLQVTPFMRGRMVCALPEGHVLAERQSLSLSALSGHSAILFRSDIPFGTLIAAACQRAGVELDAATYIAGADQALALVAGGLGLAIVDEFTPVPAGAVVRPIDEEIGFTACFLTSQFQPPSAHLSLLMEQLRAQAATLQREILPAIPGRRIKPER